MVGALSLQRLLAASQQKGSPEWQELDEIVRSGLARLVVSQHKDGGWAPGVPISQNSGGPAPV